MKWGDINDSQVQIVSLITANYHLRCQSQEFSPKIFWTFCARTYNILSILSDLLLTQIQSST